VRTIALEEHFWTPELAAPPGTGPLAAWGQRVDDQLRDLGKTRLADMDANDIDLQVISHAAPAAQGLDGAEGIARAAEANDRLAVAVRAHPDRFAGFATLPTVDPLAAADELERATKDLGLIGALVNSTLGSNGAFLDDARFEPLLERFEQLDVPLYLHPAPPSAALHQALYHGLAPAVAGRLATGAWGWHAEAGLHVLRMIATGVFDRHPRLRLIAGHCGEMVPFMLARIDAVLRVDGLELAPSGYFLRNIWVTTSGLFSLPPVLCTVQVLGVDRVLFSVDYPFGSNAAGRALLDTLPLAPADVAKIAGGNAERVLGLGPQGNRASRPSGPADQRTSGPARRDLSHVDVVKKFALAERFTAQ
jgi:predicted TIM-barrel fold metal-dependent hydrolase